MIHTGGLESCNTATSKIHAVGLTSYKVMTLVQGLLAIFGATLALLVIVYTVWCLVTGRRTVSGFLRNAHRFVVALVGFFFGFVVGMLFSHWWFPTVGD